METESGGLSNGVRTSCRSVMDRADHVQLVSSGLDRIASVLSQEPPPPVPKLLAFDGDLAMRCLAGNAINFGSGYHDLVRKEPGMSGARSMLWRLLGYLDSSGPLTAPRLGSFTIEDCSQIFGQELDGGAVEQLMGRFAIALNDLGSFIDDHGGSALAILIGCDGSAVRLAELLASMPFYRDVDMHRGETVSFYKRAQITPADLYRQGIWRFDDLPQLTAFADNLVPHVLRLDGAIEVDPSVVAAIEQGIRLEPGSAPEVELRAASVVAVEEIVARVGRNDVWPMHVDEWLWERGGGPTYKAVRRPRSRSVFY